MLSSEMGSIPAGLPICCYSIKVLCVFGKDETEDRYLLAAPMQGNFDV